MNARRKLNVAYVNGSLFLAGVIASLFQSWPVFIVGVVVAVATDMYLGGIRLFGKSRQT